MLNDKHFEECFNGYEVPLKLKDISKEICIRFDIKGVCDPMYIVNVIAYENNIDIAAKRLQGSFGCNIKENDITELINILKR